MVNFKRKYFWLGHWLILRQMRFYFSHECDSVTVHLLELSGAVGVKFWGQFEVRNLWSSKYDAWGGRQPAKGEF